MTSSVFALVVVLFVVPVTAPSAFPSRPLGFFFVIFVPEVAPAGWLIVAVSLALATSAASFDTLHDSLELLLLLLIQDLRDVLGRFDMQLHESPAGSLPKLSDLGAVGAFGLPAFPMSATEDVPGVLLKLADDLGEPVSLSFTEVQGVGYARVQDHPDHRRPAVSHAAVAFSAVLATFPVAPVLALSSHGAFAVAFALVFALLAARARPDLVALPLVLPDAESNHRVSVLRFTLVPPGPVASASSLARRVPFSLVASAASLEVFATLMHAAWIGFVHAFGDAADQLCQLGRAQNDQRVGLFVYGIRRRAFHGHAAGELLEHLDERFGVDVFELMDEQVATSLPAAIRSAPGFPAFATGLVR